MEQMFIVVWKTDNKGKIWTVEDAAGDPVRRNYDGVKSSVFAVISDAGELEEKLSLADGTRYGVEVNTAAYVLGWDL